MRSSKFVSILPPVIVGITGLAIWEGAVNVFDIKEFLLPKPSSIWARLFDEWGELRHATWETGKIAISGLLIGIFLGVLLALITNRFKVLSDGLTPLAIAVNATPIVALAPIFNAWFGITGTFSNDYYAMEMLNNISNKGYNTFESQHNGLLRVGITIDCQNLNLDSLLFTLRSEFSERAWFLIPDYNPEF